jgi:hypothetical protein
LLPMQSLSSLMPGSSLQPMATSFYQRAAVLPPPCCVVGRCASHLPPAQATTVEL